MNQLHIFYRIAFRNVVYLSKHDLSNTKIKAKKKTLSTTQNVTFNILKENKNEIQTSERAKINEITRMMNTFANSKLNFVNVFLFLDTQPK